MAEKVTVIAMTATLGPRGVKMAANKMYEFDDEPYVRLLVKSGQVELVDPPHFDYIDKPTKEPVKVKGYVKEPDIVTESDSPVKEEVVSDGDNSDPESGRNSEATGGTDGPEGSGKKSGQRSSKSPDAGAEGLGGLRQEPLRF